jgi:hypothetical protein
MSNLNDLCNDSTLMEALLLLKSSDPPSPNSNLVESQNQSQTMNIINNDFFDNPLSYIEQLPDHVQLTLSIVALQFESSPQSVNQLCLNNGLVEWPSSFIESYEFVITIIETMLKHNSSIDSSESSSTKVKLKKIREDISRYKSTELQNKSNVLSF